MGTRARSAVVGVLVAVMVLCGAGSAFGATGDYLGKWGVYGIGNGEFNNPNGVGVAPNGDIYVADTYNHRIQYFSSTGTYKGKWGMWGTGNGQFSYPGDVAVAPNGDVYVTDAGNHRIQHFSATGTYKGKWGSGGSSTGEFYWPFGIAIAPNGDVYVADSLNRRIQYFSPTGTYKGTWGSSGTSNGQFSMPRGITVAPHGDVYVADRGNDRIQYFGPTGTYKGKWASGKPSDVAASWNGHVYVTEEDNRRVRYYGWDGTYKGQWGSSGTGDGQFNQPMGIAVYPQRKLFPQPVYVADTYNDRIQRFAAPLVATIDSDGGGVTFGRWVTGYNSAYYGGSYAYTRWAGETLEVRFWGTRITWVGPKQPNYGIAEVYIDGVSNGLVNCYASPAARSTEAVVWQSGTLAEGWHTLRIRATGNKSVLSTGTIVVADRFFVDGTAPKSYAARHDEMTGTLAGPWIYGANSAYYKKGYHYSRYPNASFTRTFTGTRVAWIGPKTGSYGRARVYIDGVQQGTVVSQYGPMAWRAKIWESKTLSPGTHTIKIVPTGTKDAASRSTNIVIDAIDVTP